MVSDPLLVVELPLSLFSREAVKRAAYALMHRVTIEFSEGADTIICTLVPERADADRATLVRDFRREVVDHDLRLSIEAQTEPVRSVVLGLAFSRTQLQDG